MELLSKVGRYEFLSEPFHCDYSSHLFMGHLGNHLLNAADFHSNDRGYGMNYLMPRHRTWVLSRLAIEMTEMPKSYDKFAVETWVEESLKQVLGSEVNVAYHDGKGKLTVHFYSDEQLRAFANLLGQYQNEE